MVDRSRENLPALTGLRGLMAVLVATHHLFGRSYIYGKFQPTGWGWQTLADNGGFAVDVFFALSGFIMVHSYGHFFSAGLHRDSLIKFFSGTGSRGFIQSTS